MKKTETINIIRETGVIAIMRAKSSGQLIAAADAIKKGGVRAIEVTMTTPNSLALANFDSDPAVAITRAPATFAI